jgi:hypothetical protein
MWSEAWGVPQDEDSFPLVRRANFFRAEYACFISVTIFFQIAEDCGESKRDMTLDVFGKNPGRSNCSDMLAEIGP